MTVLARNPKLPLIVQHNDIEVAVLCHVYGAIVVQYKRKEENQLDATEWCIAIMICSTCFGHSYAHHHELETILVLLQHMVCNPLVAGSRLFGVEQQAVCPR